MLSFTYLLIPWVLKELRRRRRRRRRVVVTYCFRRVRKMAKATISFVMFVRLSVHMEQLVSHCTDFHIIWYLSIFRKTIKKIQVSLKSDTINGYFTWKPIYIFLSYPAQFFLEWEMLRTKVVEEIKTRILCSLTFFLKSCPFLGNVEKYWRAGQATVDSSVWRVGIACWVTKATHTHTHTEYIILFAFPLLVARTRLHVAFIRALPVLILLSLQ